MSFEEDVENRKMLSVLYLALERRRMKYIGGMAAVLFLLSFLVSRITIDFMEKEAILLPSFYFIVGVISTYHIISLITKDYFKEKEKYKKWIREINESIE